MAAHGHEYRISWEFTCWSTSRTKRERERHTHRDRQTFGIVPIFWNLKAHLCDTPPSTRTIIPNAFQIVPLSGDQVFKHISLWGHPHSNHHKRECFLNNKTYVLSRNKNLTVNNITKIAAKVNCYIGLVVPLNFPSHFISPTADGCSCRQMCNCIQLWGNWDLGRFNDMLILDFVANEGLDHSLKTSLLILYFLSSHLTDVTQRTNEYTHYQLDIVFLDEYLEHLVRLANARTCYLEITL